MKYAIYVQSPLLYCTASCMYYSPHLQNFLLEPVKYLFLKTAWQGAQTTIYCAVSEEMEGVSGQYLSDCKIKKLSGPQATDDSIAERLWEVSMQMVGLEEEQ